MVDDYTSQLIKTRVRDGFAQHKSAAKRGNLQVVTRGVRIGGCEVIRQLGEGGMGQVYLALQLHLQRQVAVKILSTRAPSSRDTDRFLREAQRASQFAHPNVVQIYDTGRHGELSYIVMEFVDGKNLSEIVRDLGGPLRWPLALQTIRFVARGLQAVHAERLIHRDIKPGNIMVSNSSRVVLMDFGLARSETGSDTVLGQIAGTPSYMSPEQCRGEELDRQTDIYSLAGTLYFLLTGRPPFQGQTADIVTRVARGERPVPVRKINPSVDPGVADLINRSMAVKRRDRIASATQFIQEIDRLLQNSGNAVGDSVETVDLPLRTYANLPARGAPVSSGSPRRFKTLAAVGVATFVGVLAILGLFFLSSSAVQRQSEAISNGGLPEVAPNITPQESDPARPSLAGMVRIPAGTASLGNDSAALDRYFQKQLNLTPDARQSLMKDELFVRERVAQVSVPAFYIDKYEVTNAQYREFLLANPWHRSPPKWNGTTPPIGRERYPVAYVSIEDAAAYAAWAKKSLPTVAQWTRAFRGATSQLFPWGDEYDATRSNTFDNKLTLPDTTPVDATPKDVSAQGVYNLAGNVSEWTCDRTIAEGRSFLIVKGGHFKRPGKTESVGCVQIFATPDARAEVLGFRCVVTDP